SFSPKRNQIITTSEDRTARLWDAATAHQTMTIPHDKPVRGGTFSPDDRAFVTTTEKSTRVWDLLTGNLLRDHLPTGIGVLSYSETGQHLIETGNFGIYSVISAKNGGTVFTATEDKFLSDLSSAGTFFAVTKHDKSYGYFGPVVYLYDAETGRE